MSVALIAGLQLESEHLVWHSGAERTHTTAGFTVGVGRNLRLGERVSLWPRLAGVYGRITFAASVIDE